MSDRPITGRHVAYLQTCKRKLWLWMKGVELETSSAHQNAGQQKVEQANALQDSAYPNRNAAGQQLMLEVPGFAGRVDFFDAREGVVHETKPSTKLAESHRWQLRFYLWMIREMGLGPATGVLEYPKQKQRETVELTDDDVKKLEADFEEIRRLESSGECPPVINKPFCKNCAYYDLCYIGAES